MAGRPLGAQNKDKPWAEALRRTVFRDGLDGRRRLLVIAESCATAAEAGDMQAIKEIGDRLDGRPAQESMVTIEKRDATDWTREQLAAILAESNAADGGGGTLEADGSLGEPDSVH